MTVYALALFENTSKGIPILKFDVWGGGCRAPRYGVQAHRNALFCRTWCEECFSVFHLTLLEGVRARGCCLVEKIITWEFL